MIAQMIAATARLLPERMLRGFAGICKQRLAMQQHGQDGWRLF